MVRQRAGEEKSMGLLGVLLDVDGTLVDSNDAHAEAWVAALAENGVDVPLKKVRRLIGKGGDKLLPEAAGIAADSPKGKAISKRRGELFQEQFLPVLRPFPGVKELLARMRQEKLRLAVASSAKDDELKGLLHVCGADQYVETRTSADDAESSKPEPDIVEAALKQIGLPADKVILLGDTPYDVEAAERAGVAVVALRCGGWDDADLTGAIAVYDSPADLLERFDESPFSASR
jgi:HAD superfamily hydrolase (TIGR01509 family)